MLPEAGLFVMADVMVVEVLGPIQEQDRDIPLPPMFDFAGADETKPLWWVVEEHVYDDAAVPDVLAGLVPSGAGADQSARSLPVGGRQEVVARAAAAATAAARRVPDGDAVVHAGHGDLSARAYLLRTTLVRSFGRALRRGVSRLDRLPVAGRAGEAALGTDGAGGDYLAFGGVLSRSDSAAGACVVARPVLVVRRPRATSAGPLRVAG